MYEEITEGLANLYVPKQKKISRKLPVFYNPVMKLNRDISILLLNSLPDKKLQIALPLSGTGVRGIRFLKELKKGKIKNISFNDNNETAVKIIKKNLNLNKDNFTTKDIHVFNKDANQFLTESFGFDYIDIDPFGSPNKFLNTAVERISRRGVLAVTATDTGCLCGTFEKACQQKYWAKPLHNEFMHETGLRILIRKIQLIASQYDRALIPMFSYSKDHYFRVFFRCKKGKKHVEHVLKQHRFILFCRNCLNRSISEKNSGKCECKKEFEYGGPLWTGLLWDSDLVKQMMKNSSTDFLKIIYDESKVLSKTGAGIYDIHAICRKHKLKKIPKKQDIIERIKKKKHPVSETHLSPYGLRTDMQIKELIKLIKK